MSRGHGVIQQRILTRLRELEGHDSKVADSPDPGIGITTLAGHAYRTEHPTAQQIRSVRRSLVRLIAEGYVQQTSARSQDGQQQHRLVVSDDDGPTDVDPDWVGPFVRRSGAIPAQRIAQASPPLS